MGGISLPSLSESPVRLLEGGCRNAEESQLCILQYHASMRLMTQEWDRVRRGRDSNFETCMTGDAHICRFTPLPSLPSISSYALASPSLLVSIGFSLCLLEAWAILAHSISPWSVCPTDQPQGPASSDHCHSQVTGIQPQLPNRPLPLVYQHTHMRVYTHHSPSFLISLCLVCHTHTHTPSLQITLQSTCEQVSATAGPLATGQHPSY